MIKCIMGCTFVLASVLLFIGKLIAVAIYTSHDGRYFSSDYRLDIGIFGLLPEFLAVTLLVAGICCIRQSVFESKDTPENHNNAT